MTKQPPSSGGGRAALATVDKEYVRIETQRRVTLAEYAPAAWEASCDLMGGEERVKNWAGIGRFAVNLRQGADKPYRPASAEES